MAAPTEPTYHYYTILPEHGPSRVLLLPTQGGWTLPNWSTHEPHFWQSCDHVNRTMLEMYGVNVTTLRCVRVHRDPETGMSVRVHSLDNHSPDWQPPEGAHWLGRNELASFHLVIPAHRTLIETAFNEAEGTNGSPLRVPWSRRGWYAEAVRWIEAKVGRTGSQMLGPPEQLRAWDRSCVFRVPTSAGNLYFKALPRMFAHELPLLERLSDWHPRNFPRLLAVDAQRLWLLMEDFGGTALHTVAEVAVWEAALAELGRLQIELAPKASTLVANGVPYRELDWLSTHIDWLLDSLPGLNVYGRTPLSGEELSQLREFAPRLKAMCSELESYNLPLSLEHGDLSASNIVVNDRFIYFDWSDCSITHPFFSLTVFYGEGGVTLPNAPHVEARLRDAYLQPWTRFEPLDRLRSAFELAQVLAPLHGALGYYTHILPNMEHKWEMENMPPFFLRIMLDRVMKRET
jgi:hypothetical protein